MLGRLEVDFTVLMSAEPNKTFLSTKCDQISGSGNLECGIGAKASKMCRAKSTIWRGRDPKIVSLDSH